MHSRCLLYAESKHAWCRLGLIPLVSRAVHTMKGPFDDIGDNDFTDVELSLSIICTADDTIDVTSNDFTLDQRHPEVHPVGEAYSQLKPSCLEELDNGITTTSYTDILPSGVSLQGALLLSPRDALAVPCDRM